MSIQSVACEQIEPSPPSWAVQWADGGEFKLREEEGLELTTRQAEHATLISLRLPDAVDLDAPAFEQRVAEMYRRIRLELNSLRHVFPVRFWNYLPGIHQTMDASRDRYMVFNAGRFTAMRQWFGLPEQSSPLYPAASAVGHDGRDLVIHCLALERSGVMIDNPRQVPAFRYSSRYGPRPPCFARGTLVHRPNHRGTLLAAGTASIRGQQSVHVGQLPAQIAETLENLQALLRSAGGLPETSTTLASFTDIRVYHSRVEDRAEVESAGRRAFGAGTRLEFCRADLCRADLLVEIEEIAPLPPGAQQ